jgi:class 3 adenylate cyclase
MSTPAATGSGRDGPASVACWLELADGRRVEVGAACSVGRADANNLVLAGDRVSRHHAMVQRHGGGDLWLTDLGSSNGTFLNGRRVSQATPIYDSDQIAIGPHRLVFRHPGGRRRPGPEATLGSMTLQDCPTSNCWLLLVQLPTATRLAETMAVEKVPALLSDSLERCRVLVEDHGGRINRYLPGGCVAHWRDMPDTRASVASALQGLKALQDGLDAPGRLCLHYGPVRLDGTSTAGEQELAGAALSLLFRMEKLAENLRVSLLVTEVAQALLAPRLRFVEAGQHALAGFDGEQPFYRL